MASVRVVAVSAALAAAFLLPQSGRAEDKAGYEPTRIHNLLALNTLSPDPNPNDVGYQAIRNRDWATAERQLRAGLEKNPGDVFRQLNLAWVYVQTGRKSEAEAIYRQILMSGDDRMAALPSREGRSVRALAERGLALLQMD